MAVVENNFRVSRLGGDFSPVSRDSMLSDDGELRSESSLFESDVEDDNEDNDQEGEEEEEEDEEEYDDDEEDDVDSGAGSDDFDLSDLGEIGAEFCQVGNRNCSLPFELYDLPDLTGVLSMDAWNNCLTEEERFGLAEYLPDVDQATFMRTLKELFAGSNFHFGSPLNQLFHMLKGGLCEPRVALFCRGLNFLEKRRHYHHLRKYQNSMVSSITQIRDAWENCAAYSIEERLRVLNILRSKKSLMYEEGDMLGSETDSSVREESINGLWSKRGKDGRLGTKSSSLAVHTRRPSLDVSYQGKAMALKPAKYRKQNPKGVLDVTALKASSKKDRMAVLGRFPSLNNGLEMKSRPSVLSSSLHRHDRVVGYDSGTVRRPQGHMRAADHGGEQACGVGIQKKRSMGLGVTVANTVNLLKSGKRQEFLKNFDADLCVGLGEEVTESYSSMPFPVKNENFPYSKKNAKTMEVTVKPVNDRYYEHGKKAKYPKKLHRTLVEGRLQHAKECGPGFLSKGSRVGWLSSSQPFQHGKTQEEALCIDHQDKFDDWDFRNKKRKTGEEFMTGKRSTGLDSKIRTYRTASPQMNESYFPSDHRARTSDKIRRNYTQNGGLKMEDRKGSRMFTRNEETESDSSGQVDKDEDIIHSTRRLGNPSGIVGGGLSVSVSSDLKKVNKIVRKAKNEYDQVLDGVLHASVKVGGLGEQSNMPEIEIFSSKGKKRDKMSELSYLHGHAVEHLEKNSSNITKLADVRKQIKTTNSQMRGGPSERLKVPLLKACSESKLKGKVDMGSSVPESNYIASGVLEGGGLHASPKSVGNQASSNGSGKKSQMTEANFHDASPLTLSGCNPMIRKRKGKVDATHVERSGEPNFLQSSTPEFSKKRVKNKVDDEPNSSPMVTSDALISERGMVELEPETKPLKKPFTLITPSIHTGFSFSIVHLLTAVRMAMVTVHAEDASEVGNHLEKIDGRMNLKDGHDGKLEGDAGLLSHENMHMNHSEHIGQKSVPSLTVQEIVDRVKSNPRLPNERRKLSRLKMGGWNSIPLEISYQVLGWIAFVSWSISFYPQVILNYRRKSVVGLNFDFLVLNLTKHSSYLIYNAALYFSPVIQRQYHEKYGFGEMIPVAANDVAFSIHAVLLTAITLFQVFIYERGSQKVSKTCIVLTFAVWTAAVVCIIIAWPSHSWLWLISVFNSIQVFMTAIKYIPQAIMNFARKSTEGWSIGNILLDLLGGLTNFAQMGVQSIDQGTFVNFYGNIGKTLLSLEVVFFDFVFIFQHYVLYHSKKINYTKDGAEKEPLMKSSGESSQVESV